MPETSSTKLFPPNPLTPYDVLGYLAPGSTLLLAVLLFEFWVHEISSTTELPHTPVYTAVVFSLSFLQDANWVVSGLFFIVALTSVYILGHVVASVSALFIDRFYIYGAHGYPFELLLGLRNKVVKSSELNPISGKPAQATNFYRALVFWINAYLVLRYGIISLEICASSDSEIYSSIINSYGKIIRVATQIAGWMFGILLVLRVVEKMVCSGNALNSLFHRINEYAACPYTWIANGVGFYLHTHEPFDKTFREHYKVAFRRLFAMDPDESGTNNYWFSIIYLKQQSPILSELADNWLRLYGFVRNLGTGFYLAFLYAFFWLIWQRNYLSDIPTYEVSVLVFVPVFFFLGALVMLIRYYYLYVGYYTKYVFRCFVYLSLLQKGEGGSKPSFWDFFKAKHRKKP